MKNLLYLLLLLFQCSLFAQTDAPYAVFGHEGKVLDTPVERINFMKVIPVTDDTGEVAFVGIDPAKNKYHLFNTEQELLLTKDCRNHNWLGFIA